ncbi:MAG TPA: NAD(P)/FAD-dependent oxidoreductase [Dehalococcoidia bacterium]|nr:NAD(P)/FAD-dependent oxidoreductase [Dehalococcoidia bacterium]
MTPSGPLYDVVVVGAGPAGSRTARELARRGLRVALVEEHRQVGIPSHCSGLISPRTWELGEMADDSLVCNHLRGAYVHVHGGGTVELGGDRVQAVAIDRVRWDQALAEQAYRAGAEAVQARCVGVERTPRGMLVRLQHNGHEAALSTRLVVGADGAHSRVARSLGLPLPPERVVALGVEAEVHLPRQDYVHVFVGPELAPGWFGWAIPLGDGRARLGIGCWGGAGAPLRCYRLLKEAFPSLLGRVRELRFYGGTIPLAPARFTYGDGVLLVGDAAGQVKPFSGGGIYTGLVAAHLCAEAAVAALARDDLSADGLAPYQRAWQRRLGRELARSRRLRLAGLTLRQDELSLLAGVLSDPQLRGLAVRYADIDYPSRTLLRLALAAPSLGPLALVALRRPAVVWHLLGAFLGL